jgi:LysM repeat protein
MKKILFSCIVLLVALIAGSCKSVPVEQEQEQGQEPEQELEPIPAERLAFSDAYQAVLPLIMDKAEHYVVKKGDTLTKIARAKYSQANAFFFPLIMAASKEQKTVDIVDPDLIKPGMDLVIPNLELNRDDPEIRARIKTLLVSVADIYKNRPETRWSSELVDGLLTSARDL